MTELPLSILFTVIALCVSLGMAWVVIKFMSKAYNSRATGGDIKLLTTFALGTRQQLYVVNFRDTDYFLGVTNDSISVLDSCPAKTNAPSRTAPPLSETL